MRSGMSSFEQKGWFNRTLLKKNLTRFWPLWALYTAALFFSLGMPLINLESVMHRAEGATVSVGSGLWNTMGEVLEAMNREYMVEQYQEMVRDAMGAVVLMGAVYGCFLAMAFFSYLMNRRSVGMLHALPIKREGLFLTNWVSGLFFVAGPSLVVFLIALLAEAGKGAVGLEDLLLWLLVSVSTGLFFFDFALCCAMFTGHILALPVFYLILNGLVAGMYFLFGMAMQILFVGYAGGRLSFVSQYLVEWLTPIAHIAGQVTEWNTVELPDGSMRDSLMSGALAGSAYAILAGAALLLIAFWVYRARQMERAEDLVTVGWVKPIFRYGVGVCTGFALGTMLHLYFVRGGVVGYIILVTLCAVIGGFAGQMFLRKTLRVLRSGWKGSLVLGGCMLLLLCGIRMDVGGFQSRVPDPEGVKQVYLSNVHSQPSDGAGWLSVTLRDPELIAQAVGIHQSLIQDLDKLERADRGDWDYSDDDSVVSLRLSYIMKDGSELERRYDTIPIRREDLEEPNSFAARLLALLEEPEVLWSGYLSGDWAEEPEVLTAMGGCIRDYRTYDVARDLEYEEAQILWAAIQEDINAGRYHRYLFYVEAGPSTMDRRIELDLYGIRTDEETGERIREQQDIQVMLQPTATATIRALEELGYTWLPEGAEGQAAESYGKG